MSITIDTKDGMAYFQIARLAAALRLQRDTGLTHSRGSVQAHCKREYGTIGNVIWFTTAQMEMMRMGMEWAKGIGKEEDVKFPETPGHKLTAQHKRQLAVMFQKGMDLFRATAR